MFKDLFVNLQRQKICAAQAAAFGQRFLCHLRGNKSHRIAWGNWKQPQRFCTYTLTARNAVFSCH